jgi:hypothetical protein
LYWRLATFAVMPDRHFSTARSVKGSSMGKNTVGGLAVVTMTVLLEMIMDSTFKKCKVLDS